MSSVDWLGSVEPRSPLRALEKHLWWLERQAVRCVGPNHTMQAPVQQDSNNLVLDGVYKNDSKAKPERKFARNTKRLLVPAASKFSGI